MDIFVFRQGLSKVDVTVLISGCPLVECVTLVSSTGEGVSVPTELLQMLQGQLQVLFNATPKVPFGCDSPYFGK
jgi:hypothetical protein